MVSSAPHPEGATPLLRVRGCDDSTTISLESFTEKEIQTLRKAQALVNEIGGGCMPTLHFGRMAHELNVNGDPYEFFLDEEEEAFEAERGL